MRLRFLLHRQRDHVPAAPGNFSPFPDGLVAAGRSPAKKGSVAKVSIAGDDVLCVIGDEGASGSPADWYAAMRNYAEQPPANHLEERPLPWGLRAIAVRGQPVRGQQGLLICVSVLCTVAEQKAAVVRLLRAARRERWCPAAFPPFLAPAEAAWNWAKAWYTAHRALGALAVLGAVASSAAVVIGLGLLPAASSRQGPAAPAGPSAGITRQPKPQPTRSRASHVSHQRTVPSHRAVAARSRHGSKATSTHRGSALSRSSGEVPAPPPTGTPAKPADCITLLGATVCV